MKDLIRPFKNDGKFDTLEEIQKKMYSGRRPNDGASRLGTMSVLQNNGMVNITPFHGDDNELDKESIKKCMFSIENLAWKSMLTIKDKKARTSENQLVLSEEQRGPNGGRIMWFPPYNLKFSENISTNWNQNGFIGRGENIYTYSNTERGGTLSFTLLVDHPSIVADWSKNAADSTDNEMDILRFFAGCEMLSEDNAPTAESNETTADVEGKTTVKETGEMTELKFFVFFPNNYSGAESSDPEEVIKYLCTGSNSSAQSGNGYEVSKNGTELIAPIEGKYVKWYYNIDASDFKDQKLRRYESGGIYYILEKDGTVRVAGEGDEKIANNRDTQGYYLNSLNDDAVSKIKSKYSGLNDFTYGTNLFSFTDAVAALDGSVSTTSSKGEKFKNILEENKDRITEIKVNGYASSHGDSSENTALASKRAQTIISWLKKCDITSSSNFTAGTPSIGEVVSDSISSDEAKLARSVEVTISFSNDVADGYKNMGTANNATGEAEKSTTVQVERVNTTGTTQSSSYSNTTVLSAETPSYLSDAEYKYFKHLAEDNSIVMTKIVEKIKFFNPAFHSITPEGFNARLTFLHQCTRQGPTPYEETAKNLAFGVAPYCVLRIGDFYNTKIVIDSVSIDYGENQWDLNPEGIGVQPIMANVNINFKFIGGSDISGPINRLQNAISFNYYSNTSIYDARSDYRTVETYTKEEGSDEVSYWDPFEDNS